MKALVVGGSSNDRQAIVEMLETFDEIGVQYDVADLNGAIRTLAEQDVDLVITHGSLDDGTGMQVIAVARQIDRAPWIVVAGHPRSREEWLQYLRAGADRVVELDRDLRELRDVTAKLVRASHLRAAAERSKLLARLSHTVLDFQNHVGLLASTLDLLERSPGEARFWAGARAAIEDASRAALTLLGDVRSICSATRDP